MKDVCGQLLAFLRGERGAVTVDWIVMTAAAVSLALGTMLMVQGSSQSNAEYVAGIGTEHVATTTFGSN